MSGRIGLDPIDEIRSRPGHASSAFTENKRAVLSGRPSRSPAPMARPQVAKLMTRINFRLHSRAPSRSRDTAACQAGVLQHTRGDATTSPIFAMRPRGRRGNPPRDDIRLRSRGASPHSSRSRNCLAMALSNALATTAVLLLTTSLQLRAGAGECPSSLRFAIGSTSRSRWLKEAAGAGVTFATLSSQGISSDDVVPVARTGHNPNYCVRAPSGAVYCSTGGGERAMASIRQPGPRVERCAQTSEAANHMAAMRASAPGEGDRVFVADYLGKLQAWVARGDDPARWRYNEWVVPSHLSHNLTHRQKAPHPHQTLPLSETELLLVDLGADRVFRFSVGRDVSLRLTQTIPFTPGDGPRHAAQHPRFPGTVYVINEFALDVVRLQAGGCSKPAGLRGSFEKCERRGTLDVENPPGATAAAIRITDGGRFLYASVRYKGKHTPGSIAAFALNADGSIGRKVGVFSAQGVHPRDFSIVERFQDASGRCGSFLAVVNRDSNHVVFVPRDAKTGVVGDSVRYRLNVKTPTSVLNL